MEINKKEEIVIEIDGKEESYNILFSYHVDELDKDFMILFKKENEEDLFVVEVLKDGSIIPVEDKKMVEIANEMLEMYDDGLKE